MADILKDYFDALERLKNGRPDNVRKGTKINNDNVSLEAGRKKGSIKRSRPIFAPLIAAIDLAAKENGDPIDEAKEQLIKAKAEAASYRKRWEESLCREVSRFKQLWDEREAWAKKEAALTGQKVSSILSEKTRRGR